jgi:hypothetical protein
MAQRDRKDYQIMVEGKAVKLVDATREQIELALMTALDVVHAVETDLRRRPSLSLLDAFITGRDTETEKLLEKIDGEDGEGCDVRL